MAGRREGSGAAAGVSIRPRRAQAGGNAADPLCSSRLSGGFNPPPAVRRPGGNHGRSYEIGRPANWFSIRPRR